MVQALSKRASAKRKTPAQVARAVLEDSDDEMLDQPRKFSKPSARVPAPQASNIKEQGKSVDVPSQKPVEDQVQVESSDNDASQEEALDVDGTPERSVSFRATKRASGKTPGTEVASTGLEESTLPRSKASALVLGVESSSVLEHTSMEIQPPASKVRQLHVIFTLAGILVASVIACLHYVVVAVA